MSIASVSAAVTPRGLVCAAASVVGAACFAFTVAVALPMASSASGGALLAKPDFDFVFASLASKPKAAAVVAEAIITDVPIEPPVVLADVPPAVSAIDFDLTFASVLRRDNTPANREKLRNAGWQRLLRKG